MATPCALRPYRDGLWTVDVRVADHDLRVLFDLGAGISALDVRVARDLGLRETRRVAGRRMTGDSLDVAMLEPAALSVGGHALGARSFGRLDLGPLLPRDWPRVDGVLGLDALEPTPFAVDFAHGRLDLGVPFDPSGLLPVPVRVYRQVPGVSVVALLAVASPGGDLWFELDNSNTGPVLVSPAAAARLGLPASPSVVEADLPVRGLGPVRTPVLVRDLLYDGNLGRTFTGSRRFVFDLAASRMGVVGG